MEFRSTKLEGDKVMKQNYEKILDEFCAKESLSDNIGMWQFGWLRLKRKEKAEIIKIIVRNNLVLDDFIREIVRYSYKDELVDICHKLGVNEKGIVSQLQKRILHKWNSESKEISHEELLEKHSTTKDLKDFLWDYSFPVSGNKKDLIRMIIANNDLKNYVLECMVGTDLDIYELADLIRTVKPNNLEIKPGHETSSIRKIGLKKTRKELAKFLIEQIETKPTKVKKTVTSISTPRSKSENWVYAITEENWEVVKEKQIWGTGKEYRIKKLQKGDIIIFYVKKTGFFKGIFNVVSDWYESKEQIWADELRENKIIYPFQIKLETTQLGNARYNDLVPNLEFVKKKQHHTMYLQMHNTGPSNFGQPIQKNDFDLILMQMQIDRGISYVRDQKGRVGDWIKRNFKTKEELKEYVLHDDEVGIAPMVRAAKRIQEWREKQLSPWETKVMEKLEKSNIKFQKKPRKLPIEIDENITIAYLPDFVLDIPYETREHIIVEVEENLSEKGVKKFRAFMDVYGRTYWMIVIVESNQLHVWKEFDKGEQALYHEIWPLDKLDQLISMLKDLDKKYEENRNLEQKICPKCGKKANGRHEIEKIFGYRGKIPQSWCLECRSNKNNNITMEEIYNKPKTVTCPSCREYFMEKIRGQAFCESCLNKFENG